MDQGGRFARPGGAFRTLGAGIGLSALMAVAGIGARAAAPVPNLQAPIRALDFPADGSPNDALYALQTDLVPIGVPTAWARSTGVPSVIVAVLDSGVDAAQSEFAGRLVPGFNALTGVADTATNLDPTNDDLGHGTRVTGTIAAAANNGAGIAGIAPGISIMPIKVLDATGTGDFSGLVAGVDWAIANGARIVSMSFGGTMDAAGVDIVQTRITAAHTAGTVLIAAAGNSGTFASEYPCNFAYVICVGSTTNDGTAVSTFSTRTPAVALVAPGEMIASTLPGNAYGYASGTSMAAPHVTAAVALIRSLRPEISPDEILAALTGSALPLGAGGRNQDSGYGLLQVAAALDLVLGAADPGQAAADLAPAATADLAPAAAADLAQAPRITAVVPASGSSGVARTARPRVTLSIRISGVSTKNVTLKDVTADRGVAIRVRYDSATRVITIAPRTRLVPNHAYRITVVRVVGQDTGIPLERAFSSTFVTGRR
ncbi:MAG: S8 family serine peptidase [Chloroflexi bacterium]|nr:S8 family serine peptidase [Chloroflexota bacterium]